MYFSGWSNIVRVLVTGLAAYAGLVLLLRLSGKRTLAKLNAFDLVVTVALGSTLSAVLLPSDATLADGLAGLTLLVAAQFVIAWLQVRSVWFRRLVRSEASLLVYRGEWRDDVMRRERITRDEVLTALRSGGVAYLEQVEAAVLETDGSVSVIQRGDRETGRSTIASLLER